MNGTFEWLPEHQTLLEDLARGSNPESAWALLQRILKYKINENVNKFCTEWQDAPSAVATTTATLPPPSTQNGLIIPPFPPKTTGQSRLLSSKMGREEAKQMMERVFGLMDDFEEHPPFTIQRVSELAVKPREHYRTVGKYLRALERSLLVTSTSEDFPPKAPPNDDNDAARFDSSVAANLRLTNTPIFSPIPFLHDDARRAGSSSPPLSPLQLTGTPSPSQPPRPPKVLGLVDELDDPGPGHLSDRPTALTSVPSSPIPLNERFVRSTSPNGRSDDGKKSEDDEVEDMVLDEPGH